MTEPETLETSEARKASKSQKAKVKLRQRVKARKPHFMRQESWRYKRVKETWRRPKGLDSKMRKKRSGWPESVSIGYGGPRTARNLHPSGYEEVLVHNLSQIEALNSETQAVRIAHTVGEKKRRDILTRAREIGLHVLNPRELKEVPTEAEEEITKPEAEEGREEEGEVSEIGEETEAAGEEVEEEKEKAEE